MMRRVNQRLKPHTANSTDQADLSEYQRMALFWLLLLEGVVCVGWQMFANNLMILAIAFVLHVLALWLVNKNLTLAGLAWYAAFGMVVLSAAVVYEQPLLAGLLGLLPFFYCLIFGPLPGLFSAIAFSGVLLILGRGLPPGLNGFPPDTVQLAGIGWLALFAGIIFRALFVNTIQVYYENYRKASRELDEARQQRLEHSQIQEDLVHANRELARLTGQLKIANQAAEEARRAKENFVATVSHELRTPLNMLIGFSEVIGQSPQVYGMKLPPMLLADIASIQRNSQHLLDLVNDVLDLSQVDMGNMSITRDWSLMQEMVKEAFEVIRPLYQSKKLYLKAELPEGELRIYCDATRIREVIINLLSNAGRFTEKGGVLLRAAVTNHEVVVSVQDTGPGISPENQKRLFEPFQQLDTVIHRRYGGSGLGLAISKRFVEMHGGKMWLESTVGTGTTFYFSLPAADAEAEPASSAARWVNQYAAFEARTRSFRAPLATPAPRCVVIEEGDTAKRLLNRYLGDVEILPAGGVEEAFQLLSQYPCQFILINHPNAMELLRSLNTQGSLPFSLPVLAFWLPGSLDTAGAMGVNTYLIKPVSSATLLDNLDRLGQGIQTVLVVDDNPEVLQLFGRILSTAPKAYKVLRANSGAQALEMLRKRKPDAMILDLVMPEITGFQVLAEKANDPAIQAIPVIVVTAQDPTGMPKVSEVVMFAREGGISPRDLLRLVWFFGLGGEEKRT